MERSDFKIFGDSGIVRCVIAKHGKPVEVHEFTGGPSAPEAAFRAFKVDGVEHFYRVQTGARRELRILCTMPDERTAEPNVAIWLAHGKDLGTVVRRPRGAAGRVPDDVLFGEVMAYVEDDMYGWVTMTDKEVSLACALLQPRMVAHEGGYRVEGGTKVANVPTLSRTVGTAVVFYPDRKPITTPVSSFGGSIPTGRLARGLDTDTLECVYRQASEVDPSLQIEVWCNAFAEQDGDRPNRALMLEGRYGPVIRRHDPTRQPARNELIFGCFLVYVTKAAVMVDFNDDVLAEIESWFPTVVSVREDAAGHDVYVYTDWEHRDA